MKYSDKPIVRPKEDVLGRRSVARRLASAIEKLEAAKDGFVLAIEGEWGTGKTSLVEMILWHLNASAISTLSKSALPGYEAPSFFDISQLEDMQTIYDQVHKYVQAFEYDNKSVSLCAYESMEQRFKLWLGSDDAGAKAAQYWRLQNIIDAASPYIIIRFSPWLIAGRAELATALLSEIARAVNTKAPHHLNRILARLLERFAEFAPVIGAGFEAATAAPGLLGFSKAVASTSSKLAQTMAEGPTLDQLRDELRHALANLEDQKIIIVIDDIDRLAPHEALDMVSLVKSFGNTPNVIYVLSYDRQKLESLITEALGVGDSDYLSKIVQYSYIVPPLRPTDIQQLFLTDFNAIIPTISDQERMRLAQVWQTILRHYLTTPRAVRRFVNSISVAIPALDGYIDPIDYVVLEALRLFDVGVYNFVRSNINELAGV